MTETKYVRNGIITAKLQKTQAPFPLLIYHNSKGLNAPKQ